MKDTVPPCRGIVIPNKHKQQIIFNELVKPLIKSGEVIIVSTPKRSSWFYNYYKKHYEKALPMQAMPASPKEPGAS